MGGEPTRADVDAISGSAYGFTAEEVTTLPSMTVDPDIADKVKRLTARREAIDTQWRDAIREAVGAGGSLREVAALANVSHMAVKFIAHGRPDR